MQSQYLNVALGAVKKAETVIKRYLDEGVIAELKPDQSPVTIADKQAEEIIKQEILASFPDHTFFGEEGEKTDLSNHSGFTWIIDPIDGTKSYLRKNPLFATLVALMHDGEFILGISNAPLMGELIYAEKGQGCFFNGQQVRVSTVGQVADAYLSHGALKYFENTHKTAPLLQLSKDARWARGIGDFWSYHLLAQGKLDIMIEAETKLWDIAAMTVIVQEAGGKMTKLDGNPIDHNTTNVLATNGLVHADLVNRFAS
jgi:histidinol-phosphatase